MSLDLAWYLPVAGDGRTLLGSESTRTESAARDGVVGRRPTLGYLAQVAQAAEQLGFGSVLVPTDTYCEDPWVVCAALTQRTERLKFLVAFRAGLTSPTLLAQMAATFQRISGGRLLLNVVTGADGPEMRRFGDRLDKDSRYARTDEFLTVMRGMWDASPFTHAGRYFDVEDATIVDAPRWPEIYFGGASAAALPVATHHADVYLMFGEPPGQTAQRIAALREAAAGGRMPGLGIRFHVVTRPDSDEAWTAALHLLDGADEQVIAAAQAAMHAERAVGEAQMATLTEDRDHLEVYPNLWAGIGLVRRGAGTALVGSYDEVAERMAEYHELGIDTFILSGYPNLEEAYHVGEGVLPRLRRLTGSAAT